MATSLQAQLFNQESLTGAALGGVAGAVIGNQIHGQSGEGAAIGAGIGYLLGQGVHQNRQYQSQYYSPAPSSSYYPYNQYPYYGNQPAYYGAPAPSRRPNYALTGAALGGVAGAVIGNQHHGQSGEGAAIGAAAGLLLGGIAEHRTRKREAARAAEYQRIQQIQASQVAAAQAAAQASAAQANTTSPAPPQNSSILRRGSPNMKGANQLFGR